LPWIAIALGSAAISSWTNILDKAAMHGYMRSPWTLPLLIGLIHGAIGGVITLVAPWPEGATAAHFGWAILSGVLFGLGAAIGIYVLFYREVSRVIPVWQTFPIFTSIMAVIFLDEHLEPIHWVAILVVVGGAALISVRQTGGSGRFALDTTFFALILAAFITGSAHITSKIALDELPVINTHGLRAIGLGIVFLPLGLRREAIREIRTMVRTRSRGLGFVAVNEFVIANVGLLLTLWAISQGPVSLVTTLTSTRTFFVVLYSTALAVRFPGFLGEETTRQAVTVKIASTLLIVAGIATISLR
jgi:uncharacterized membrane protein